MKKIDFAKLPTEKPNPRSKDIDILSVERVLAILSKEDQTVPFAVAKVRAPVAKAVRMIVASLGNGGRLFFAGAGTSGRLGIIEAAECPPTFNTAPSLIQAVMAGGKRAVFRSQEGAEDRRDDAVRIFRQRLRKGDCLVGIAASGVTPFVHGALSAARSKGARTILVACNAGSPMKRSADCLIAPKVGPEVITGSTRLKAGTATKFILNMLTVASMVRLGKVYRNWMVDLQPKSKKLTARALRIIQRLAEVPEKEAKEYFERAGKNAKVAILMAKKRIPRTQALKRLRQSSGFLRSALK